MKKQAFYLWCLLCIGWCHVAAQKTHDSLYKQLQTRLIMAAQGDTIALPAGIFYFKKSLSLESKNNITIRGAGLGKTILDFRYQVSGAEGIRITQGHHITLENLSVKNTRGDAIKAIAVTGLVFRNLETEWDTSPVGAYGLYPVLCKQVLVEHCQARGACDAGIYVGQSRDIVIRYCEVEENVAGINLENSIRVDVYQNLAYNNTCGILVMDVPTVAIPNGGQVRVFKNNIYRNNYRNFAPKGTMVAGVPSGSGIVVVATSQVEIFANKIANNKTLGTGVFHYDLIGIETTYEKYNPYPGEVAIYNNVYRRSRLSPAFHRKLKDIPFKPNRIPHIVYDGVIDPVKKGQQALCIRDNEVQDKAPLFANIDAIQGFKNIRYNAQSYNCTLPKLEKVWWPIE
ncbi:parallel beta-helix domain-containing protein [Microscilla marina]|uniref:Right handed beta helix domain-containing protein n=1 Tax=Microscilla marina ATCC 23134 TaxID=313606 RepID=A1ZQM6_MICM2|nr:parallel beta-helix domain-containing protein [Microscilla marina]EAY27398.1 conserved hypothetical protein [Microscilla marina ATCC 23134]